jgi:LmbE family N-acetylglucosaminyl deacetylase
VSTEQQSKLKLMCIGAHPDDECFAFGGALALAADRGIETYVLCLTDGQAATYRGDAESSEALGEIRRKEFIASCKLLGVTHQELMDYQDGRLEFVEFSRAAGRLVERIRRFKPDVVITFGSDGGLNTHNDHMMVSALTTAAFHWSGRAKRYPDLALPFQPRRLFHATTNFFIPGRPIPLRSPWTVKLDIRTVQARKAAAFREHPSQGPVMETTKALFEQYGCEEFYTLVASEGIEPAQLQTDLFEGLEA